MKFLATIAAITLPLAIAKPMNLFTGGKQIRDVDEIARLTQINSDVQKALWASQAPAAEKRDDHQLGKRFIPLLGIPGLAVVLAQGGSTGINLASALFSVLRDSKQDRVWFNTDACRVSFSTDDGGLCHVTTYARGSSDGTADHDYEGGDGCAWIGPDPGIKFFEGDEGIGKYSIQYTATDSYVWEGTPSTDYCPFEGLCNPQFVFYHEGYSLVLNTWESQGSTSRCQYSGGRDCGGVCASGVKDQFSPNGMIWGGNCAIPCADDNVLADSEV